jgi:uncharacterized protein YfaP (DUF2135 family)
MSTQLLVQFDSNYYLCSGAMVSSYHVLTSAHCVAQFDDYADSVTVSPGRDGSFAPYGSADATNIRVYEAWENSEPVAYDFALLTLDNNIGKNTGWFGYATFPATDSRYFDSIEFAGYPGDKGNGNEMYNQTGQGIYVDQFYPSTHWYTMDSQGGQSGSGVWYYNETTDEPRLLSVHGYGSSPYNLGVRIDSEKYTDLNAWIANDTAPESYVQIVDDGNSWFSITPDPLVPGETFTVESDVRNIGTADAGSYTVTYYLSSDRNLSSDDYQFAQASGATLGSLDYADVSYTGTFPSAPSGAYYVIRSTDGSTSPLTTDSTTSGTSADSVVATETTVTIGEPLTSTVTVDVTVPGDDEFVASSDVGVFGTASSDNSVIQTVEVSDDGGATWAPATYTNNTWNYTYSAAGDGDYSLLVRATDDIGTSETTTGNFSVDTTAPLVAVISPTAASPVSVDPGDSVFVDVEYSEENPDEFVVSLIKDGSVLASETTTGAVSGFNSISTEMVIPTDAPSGDYDVSAAAVDKAGNSISRTEAAAVTVISEAPSIDSVSVTPQLVSPGDQLSVSVTASDDQGVTGVTAAGVSLTQQTDGSWSGTAEASTTDGVQSLTIEATDGDGQTASTSATYEVDASLPVFDSVSLDPTVVAGGESVTVTVFASDTNGVDSVTADGVSLTQQAGDSWTGTISAETAEGIAGVTLVATDSLGNSDSTSATYTVDNTPPSVSLSAPAESTSPSVTVSGAVTDANGVSSVVFSVNGNDQSVSLASDGTFSTTVSLVEGSNTFELAAVDNAGNSASATAQTTVDMTAPTLTVNAPAQTTQTDVIVSGTVTDANGIGSLTAAVDGGAAQTIPVASDGSYSVSLSLADGPHQIVVTATDSFGNADSDAVTVEVDSVAPAVSLTAPATSDSTDVTVSGSATDASGLQTVELSVNGNAQAVSLDSNGDFSTNVSLNEGNNTIVLRAVDTFGNEATTSATTTVDLDTEAPVVTLNAPGTTADADVTVIGTVSDESAVSAVTLSVNGGAAQPITLTSDGNYSQTVSLNEGENTVTVTATDEFGNSAGQTATVLVDTSVPSLSLSAPSTSDSTTVTVTGSASDPNGISAAELVVNGNSQTLSLDSNGDFSVTVSLNEGDNTMVLQATDSLGNTASASTTTLVDTTAPAVSLSAPASSDSTSVEVSGSVTDANGLQTTELVVNGNAQTISLASDGSFTETLTLVEGENTIVLRAVDSFGNDAQTSSTTTVDLDTDAPSVTLSAPSTSNDATVTVTGTVTDESAVSTAELIVNGNSQTLSLASDGSYSVSVTLAEGENTIEVSATDEFGNTGTASTTTTVDSTIPSLSLSAPSETNDATVEVTGTATDTNGVATAELIVNGNSQTLSLDSNGDFSVTVSLQEGSNTVSLRAVDSFNNENTAQTTVTYTPLDDLAVSVSPLENPTADTIVAVSGSVQNAAGDLMVLVESPVDSNTITISEGETNYRLPVQLEHGENTVTVTVTDAEERTETAQTSTTVDSVDPSIDSISLNETTVYPGENILVTVDASDATTSVTGVTANGMTLSQTADGSWTGVLNAPASEGDYSVLFIATDEVGNTAGSSTAYTVAPKPDLALSVNTLPSLLGSPSTTVSGEVANAVGDVTITVTSPAETKTLTLSENGPFSTDVALNEGENTVTVTATDADGRTASKTVSTVVDTTAPAVSLNAPATSDSTDVVVSGSVTDASAIDTVELSVNGNAQAVSLDANGDFTTTVSLNEGENTLTLTAVDAAGNDAQTNSTTTVELDVDAPVVTVDSPTETSTSEVSVSGTVTDDSVVQSVDLTVGGETTTVPVASDGSYDASFTLADGQYTITATATDEFDNTGSASTSVLVDTTAPAVSLTAPETSDSTEVVVSGSVTDASAIDTVELSVNGNFVPVSLDAQGAFETTVTMDEGENTVTLSAVDTVGNADSVSQTTTVTVDDVAPTVTVSVPEVLNSSSSVVSGTVSDDSTIETVTVTVSDQTQTVSVASDGSYSAEFELADGNYVATTNATDAYENTGSASTSFLVDTISPSVTLNAPSNSDSTDVVVSGAVSDTNELSTVELLVNGNAVQVTLDANGDFTTTVSMVEGENTATLSAVDAAGNDAQVSATTTVTLDSDAPVVTVDAPAETNTSVVTVSGTVTDNSAVNTADIIVGDETVTVQVASDGTYESSFTLTDGQYIITATATDEFDNTGSASTSVLVDTTAPEVSLNAPETSNSTEVDVSGYAVDAFGVSNVELLVNGDAAPVTLNSQGAFETTVTMAEGENTLTFTAVDNVGNENSVSQTTTVSPDSEAPVLTLNVPAVSGVADVEVSGVVTDGSGVDTASLYVDDEFRTDVVLSNGEFSTTLSLNDGEHTVELRATDTKGNAASTSTVVFVDTTSPAVSLNAPATSETTDVSISGTVTDDGVGVTGATVYVNGNSAGDLTLASDGSYSTAVSLVEGENTIEVRADDAVDNTGSATATTTVAASGDDTAPKVSLDIPFRSGSSTVDITGFVTDDTAVTSVELLVGGEPVSVEAIDGVIQTSIELEDGVYMATLTASDAAGNEASTSERFKVDTSDPEITLNVPETSDSTEVVITATVTDASGPLADLIVNGEVVQSYSSIDGSIYKVVSLPEGENTVTLRAEDPVGNSDSVTKTVVVDLSDSDTTPSTPNDREDRPDDESSADGNNEAPTRDEDDEPAEAENGEEGEEPAKDEADNVDSDSDTTSDDESSEDESTDAPEEPVDEEQPSEGEEPAKDEADNVDSDSDTTSDDESEKAHESSEDESTDAPEEPVDETSESEETEAEAPARDEDDEPAVVEDSEGDESGEENDSTSDTSEDGTEN